MVYKSSKLDTCKPFKKELKFKEYLDHFSDVHRIHLTRWRSSAHQLAIDTGRRRKVTRQSKSYISCTMNCFENEYHVYLCLFYRDLII